MEPFWTDRAAETLTDLRTVLFLLLVLWRPWVVFVIAAVVGIASGARILASLTPEDAAHRASP